jgi:hypothetical protein
MLNGSATHSHHAMVTITLVLKIGCDFEEKEGRDVVYSMTCYSSGVDDRLCK